MRDPSKSTETRDMMVLQHSCVRSSLRWHVMVQCQGRDFFTELCCNTLYHHISCRFNIFLLGSLTSDCSIRVTAILEYNEWAVTALTWCAWQTLHGCLWVFIHFIPWIEGQDSRVFIPRVKNLQMVWPPHPLLAIFSVQHALGHMYSSTVAQWL